MLDDVYTAYIPRCMGSIAHVLEPYCRMSDRVGVPCHPAFPCSMRTTVAYWSQPHPLVLVYALVFVAILGIYFCAWRAQKRDCARRDAVTRAAHAARAAGVARTISAAPQRDAYNLRSRAGRQLT